MSVPISSKESILPSPVFEGSYFLTQVFNGFLELNQEFLELEFEECEFYDCQFTESTFRKCKFINCRFIRCNLSLVKVTLSQFDGVAFEECKLVGIDWTRAAWHRLSFGTPLSFKDCILNDCSFMGLKLDEMVLEGCKAHDVDFREGSFNRASFYYSDFLHSLFSRTELQEADFSDACFYDINILNNNIRGAKFSRDEALRLLSGLEIELVN